MTLRKLITCPESAHLEEIEYEDHPLGLLIVGCSRFEPSCAVTCARECAARLDRRRRQTQELDEVPTVEDAVDTREDASCAADLGCQLLVDDAR